VGCCSAALTARYNDQPRSFFPMPKIPLGSNRDSALADSVRGSIVARYNNSKRAIEATGAWN